MTVQAEEWGLCAGSGCGAHWSLRDEPADRMGWMCGEGCGDPWGDGVAADWEREGRRRRRAGDASLLLAWRTRALQAWFLVCCCWTRVCFCPWGLAGHRGLRGGLDADWLWRPPPPRASHILGTYEGDNTRVVRSHELVQEAGR